jgi:hypothetical protein
MDNPGSAISADFTITTTNAFSCGGSTTYGSTETSVNYSPIAFTFNTHVTITPGSYVTGASSTLAFAITNTVEIPASGKIVLEIPKRFDDDGIVESTIDSSNTAVASIVDGSGNTYTENTHFTVDENYQPSSSDADAITIVLDAGTTFAVIDAPFTITLSGCTMPYSFEDSAAFVVSTQDSNGVDIEQLTDGLITMTTAATMTNEEMSIDSNIISATDSTYTFKAQGVNPIPTGGSLWITYPTDVTYTGSTTCSTAVTAPLNSKMTPSGCTMDTGTANILKLDGLWSGGDAVKAIYITIEGWTNPASSATVTFTMATYDSTSTYTIDSVDLTVAAVPTELTIKEFLPSDDTGIN